MSDRSAETRAFLMTLARNLRAARLRLGLPVEDLAFLAEVDVPVIQALERGEGDAIDLATLGRLAWALGVPPRRPAGSAGRIGPAPDRARAGSHDFKNVAHRQALLFAHPQERDGDE